MKWVKVVQIISLGDGMYSLVIAANNTVLYLQVAQRVDLFFFFLNIYLFIYFAVSGLSCGMRDLVPWPRIELRPPALGVRVLNTGPVGNSLYLKGSHYKEKKVVTLCGDGCYLDISS